jgi:3-phenylpropionate/trans-cinnamate dioxygenase ferredoxin component
MRRHEKGGQRMSETKKLRVCAVSDIELDDIRAFEHAGRSYAVYRTEEDSFFATDGLCTHEKVSLADGLLDRFVIECPRHNGLFDIRTGEALRAPACIALTTYDLSIEDGDIFIHLPRQS